MVNHLVKSVQPALSWLSVSFLLHVNLNTPQLEL